MKKNVLVIGAGVTGLTTALELLRAGHDVTIGAKEKKGEFPASSLNAYAMWVPVAIESDPRVERWTNESFDTFADLADDETPGVAMRPIFQLKPEKSEPWYKDRVACFRHADADEFSSEYADAWVLDGAPVIDPTRYLPWLVGEVDKLGAKFEQLEISSFSEADAKFDVVVNCTSLGSRKLANDEGLYPSRMQVVKIKQNGFDRVVIDDEGPNQRSCIVPHEDYIKLGAVFIDHEESLTPDADATAGILERCKKMVPGFKADKEDIISVHCAHRPERSSIRVEVDKETLGNDRLLIHNYGHDGMGYLTSYGTAREVAGFLAK